MSVIGIMPSAFLFCPSKNAPVLYQRFAKPPVTDDLRNKVGLSVCRLLAFGFPSLESTKFMALGLTLCSLKVLTGLEEP